MINSGNKGLNRKDAGLTKKAAILGVHLCTPSLH